MKSPGKELCLLPASARMSLIARQVRFEPGATQGRLMAASATMIMPKLMVPFLAQRHFDPGIAQTGTEAHAGEWPAGRQLTQGAFA